MVDHVTDTYDFEVKVIQHGNLEITNVVYPVEIEPGAQFVVTYDVTNIGGQDTCYGIIIDKSTGSEIAGTRWQSEITSGSTSHISATLTGRATNLQAKIIIGYYTE